MRAVFLSYRRDDTQTVTGFIYRELIAPDGFGPDGVFMDIDDIPPGIDFREVIDETVGQCRFFLAVIGPRWVSPRLQHPGDFVRLEIEAALKRGIPLVPVLVDGATMPKPEDLPESLRPLVFLNAHTLRPGRQFAADIDQLVMGLHKAEEWKRRKAGTENTSPITTIPLASGTPAIETIQPNTSSSPHSRSAKTRDPVQTSRLVFPSRRHILIGSGVAAGLLAAGGGVWIWNDLNRSGLRALNTGIRAGSNAGDRCELVLPGGTKMAFAWCPPGTFVMGSSVSEMGRSKDEHPHDVRLTRGFYCGVYPVSQTEWKTVMNGAPSSIKGANLPVETVTWNEAVAFCQNVQEQTGVSTRLPTEAEWEYACRGGTTSPFCWGNELNGTQANCDGKYPYGTETKGPSLPTPSPVGSYAGAFPHPWGLADTHGNVQEWCGDWYDPDYYQRSPKNDPLCLDSGQEGHVLRGGYWLYIAQDCRSATRNKLPSNAALHAGSGFRVVFNPD